MSRMNGKKTHTHTHYILRQIHIFIFEKKDNWFYFAPISKGASSLVLVLPAIIVIFFIMSANLFYLLTYKIGLRSRFNDLKIMCILRKI